MPVAEGPALVLWSSASIGIRTCAAELFTSEHGLLLRALIYISALLLAVRPVGVQNWTVAWSFRRE
jgi:hypothetical protein